MSASDPDSIICGDAAARLAGMPESSVDLVVTSPPYYRQRSYAEGETGQEGTVEGYVDAVMAVFRECVRVTRDTGSIVFNMGDKYLGGSLALVPYRFAIRAVEDTGVLLINDITWVKTNPTPRQYQRRRVASTEPFFHFAKTKRYYYDEDAGGGDGAPARRGAAKGGPRMGRRYESLIETSGLTRAEKDDALGALREAVADVRAGRTSGFRMKIRGVHAPAFGGQDGGRKTQIERRGFTVIRLTGRPIQRDVIESPVESLKWSGHPAVYPESVVGQLVKALTPEGAVVLDPYAGSGTTCVAAKKAGRRYIGIDINPDYCDAARRRLDGAAPP